MRRGKKCDRDSVICMFVIRDCVRISIIIIDISLLIQLHTFNDGIFVTVLLFATEHRTNIFTSGENAFRTNTCLLDVTVAGDTL